MSSRPELKIAWATHEAALYACQRWHYTKKIPVNKLVKVGAWENEKFIGVVYFYNGDWRHVTDVYKRLTSDQIKRLPKRSKKGKYRYVMALDAKLRETVGALAKPYPKRAGSKAVVAPVDQAGEDGSTPIPALHKSRQRREVGGAER